MSGVCWEGDGASYPPFVIGHGRGLSNPAGSVIFAERARQAQERFNALPPEQQAAHREEQRKSFIRGMTTPCEHGVLDFEQCGECRAPRRSPVRLIAISRPVIDDVPGTPELLAFCARVSSTANQLNHESGGKLLRSLVKRQEWSPLEMISLTVEIETTRDIARQILRHRSFSFQEFSQRYAVVEDAPVYREARLQDHKDRQNSLATDDEETAEHWRQLQGHAARAAKLAYEGALEMGIAKEVARAVLPEGMTLSRLYMAGTLRSWIHYVTLRADRKTQKEHRLIAEAVRDILVEQFPDLADLLS